MMIQTMTYTLWGRIRNGRAFWLCRNHPYGGGSCENGGDTYKKVIALLITLFIASALLTVPGERVQGQGQVPVQKGVPGPEGVMNQGQVPGQGGVTVDEQFASQHRNLSRQEGVPGAGGVMNQGQMPGQASVSGQGQDRDRPLPNILWIVSEDNSPLIGAYGDDFATTPNIDRLASEGFLYTHAYANAPVCAPARNTIITGVYANSGGNQHMRSTYSISDTVVPFPHYLRQAGYYVTNNPKEDYNINPEQTREIWHESSRSAHYREREEGQPFFAVFNTTLTHESSIHHLKPLEELRHHPDSVTLPPYHPDTPEIRRDWAQFYDQIEDMDGWVGEILQELEESGEAERTIVFYYGDHGGVLPRSKRYLYETGTRVPLVVRIPEMYRDLWPAPEPGESVARLVSFVDLAPTVLTLAGVPVPDHMQGEAFLGERISDEPDYAFMFRGRMDERFDMSRSVRSHRYRYIRNYMPHRIYGQRLEYLWRAASARSWEESCLQGACDEVQQRYWGTKPAEELYDTANDPWEVTNLADDPAYSDLLNRMRQVNREWMLDIRDSGFIPEADLLMRTADGSSIYDFMRSGEVDLEPLMAAAELASSAAPDDLDRLIVLMQSDERAIRYWGATGLLILGEHGAPARDALEAATRDASPSVQVVASEALYRLGEKDAARRGWIDVIGSGSEIARALALNAIESVGEDSEAVQEAVIGMAREAGTLTRQHYDHRSARLLFEMWDLDIQTQGVAVEW